MLEKAADYVALDLETTGLNPREDMIIEIGAVKFIGGSRMENFSSFVNPGYIFRQELRKLRGLMTIWCHLPR